MAIFNFGLMIILYEMNNQFELLLSGIKDAFSHRMGQQFQEYFIDCIRHHQIIIK